MALRFFAHHPKRFRSESGVAFTETAIVLPVILVLIAAALYVSNLLHAHSLITNVAQEGARFMSRRPSLSAMPTTAHYDNLQAGATTGSIETSAHTHAMNLLRAMNRRDNNFIITDITITATYLGTIAGAGGAAPVIEDRVEITIEANVDPIGIFPTELLRGVGINLFKIRSTTSQPYLTRSA